MRNRLPWVYFIFLILVFFLSHHSISRTITYADKGIPGEEDITKAIVEGSIKRRVAMLSFFVVSLGILLMNKKKSRFKMQGILSKFLIIFVLLAIVSLTWATNPALTFRRLVILIILIVGALACSKRLSMQELIWFTFVSCGLILLVGICVEIVFGKFRPLHANYRFSGTAEPTIEATYISPLVIATMIMSYSNKGNRWLYKAIAAAAFVFLLLTRTRSSLAGVGMALLIFGIVVLPSGRKATYVLCSFFITCTLVIFIGEDLLKNTEAVVLLGRHEEIAKGTLTGRVLVWDFSVNNISQRPLLGYGFEGFWTPYYLKKMWINTGWPASDSLNGYLDITLGVGIVGVIIYLLILIIGIYKSIKLYRFTNDLGYVFACAILVYFAFLNILESQAFGIMLSNFLVMILLLKLAFGQPEFNGNRHFLFLYKPKR